MVFWKTLMPRTLKKVSMNLVGDWATYSWQVFFCVTDLQPSPTQLPEGASPQRLMLSTSFMVLKDFSMLHELLVSSK